MSVLYIPPCVVSPYALSVCLGPNAKCPNGAWWNIGLSLQIHFIPLDPTHFYRICISKILQNNINVQNPVHIAHLFLHIFIQILISLLFLHDMNSVALDRGQHELLFDNKDFGITTFCWVLFGKICKDSMFF